ncbi:DUF3572 domain-containing protein [Psychromarinibacter sp. C21-152]|uniref:DUF3572 domain-containing protein n=1 Tax=Psychromarinibacter sediminicola TaxID=3033385 RepID=A0AAE3T9Q8_9RHOB|nr:DUF3572 domain-containing protein [Psychromarinibacter sediminicola]MDF0602885.1 DUF3572 domain-containing protein [Psychromarinibacter sediminicola]
MTREMAETLAVRALAWLAESDDLFGVFLGSTGISAGEVRARAADPEFLASVLDFLAMDDAWVTAFCDAAGLPYDSVMQARAALPGGQEVHWT